MTLDDVKPKKLTTDAQLEIIKDHIRSLDISELVKNPLDGVLRLDVDKDDVLSDVLTIQKQSFTALAKTAFGVVIREKFEHFSVSHVKQIMDDTRIVIDTKKVLKLRDVTSEYANKIICFEAQVIGMNASQSYIAEGCFICPTCGEGEKEKILCNANHDFSRMPQCETIACKRQPRMLVEEKSTYDDTQEIFFREALNEVVGLPIQRLGRVYGNFVGTIKPGLKQKIVGIFLPVVTKKDSQWYDIMIDVISIDEVESETHVMPTPEEIEQFRTDAEDPDFVEKKLVASYAPQIKGHDPIKLSMLCSIVRGGITEDGGMPESINVLMVGDPGESKSIMLKFARRITQKSVYIGTGRRASNAGLTAGAEKQASGKFMPILGVIPMYHEGSVYIDELNLMKDEDKTGLQECMSDKTVSLYKMGIDVMYPADTTICAAANPEYGVFDMNKNLLDQVNVGAPLASRFHIIWIQLDIIDAGEDIGIAKHIMKNYRNKKKNDVPYDETLLLKFCNYAKGFNPEMTNEAEEAILEFYKKVRRIKDEDGRSIVDKRLMMIIIMLATAYAKLRLSKKVETRDVEKIIKLKSKSLKDRGVDVDTGEVQEKLWFQEQKTAKSKEDTIWEIFEKLKNTDGKVLLTQWIDELSKMPNFTLNSAKGEVHKLRTLGKIVVEGDNDANNMAQKVE